MKMFHRWMLLTLCALLLIPQALAEPKLWASVEGGEIQVGWSGAGSTECTLNVYRDGWPVGCYSVHGPAGDFSAKLGDANGRYSVRLATQYGCVNADAKRESAAATPMRPVETPETAAPTATPTAAPTSAPTQAPITTAEPAASGAAQSGLAAQVVAQVNAERAKAGLSELRVDAELTRAARVRAEEITRKFSHTRPDGSAWSSVSAAAYGENIAVGQRTADKVMAAWMSSEGHRANIMRASYGSIGVCAYVSGGVTYWVQLFGK